MQLHISVDGADIQSMRASETNVTKANSKWTQLAGCITATALFAAVVPAANGAFILTVTEGGGPTIPITDNGPLDNNPAISTIDVNTSVLNTLLIQFQFNGLSAASNRVFGVPASNDPGTLSQTGSVQRTQSAGTANISIVASDTGYLFPGGNPKSMATAASDVFGFTTAGDSRSFQSVFDPTNVGPPASGVSSPLLVFIPPVGAGPFGTSNPGVTTPLGTQPTPFALYNTTVVTLGANANQATPQTDQFSGATTITGVPEPTTLGIVLLCATGGIVSSRRRR